MLEGLYTLHSVKASRSRRKIDLIQPCDRYRISLFRVLAPRPFITLGLTAELGTVAFHATMHAVLFVNRRRHQALSMLRIYSSLSSLRPGFQLSYGSMLPQDFVPRLAAVFTSSNAPKAEISAPPLYAQVARSGRHPTLYGRRTNTSCARLLAHPLGRFARSLSTHNFEQVAAPPFSQRRHAHTTNPLLIECQRAKEVSAPKACRQFARGCECRRQIATRPLLRARYLHIACSQGGGRQRNATPERMISIDPHDIATRIAVSVEIENFACYYCVIPVLLWYDYFLTLSDEVKYIWNARLSVSSILFYVIRYSALLSSICEVIATRKWLRQSEMSCIMIESWVMGSIIVLYTAAAGFSAMRVYALYQRHMALALLTLVLALGNPAIYLYVYSQTAPLAITSMTAISCGIWFTQDPNFYYEKWLLGARACSIAADAIVVALTWCKTMQAMGKNFKRHRMPLMTVMVSDGTMCFLVLLILNILSLSVWHDVFYSNPMTMWISVFTPILTTRFMLDLRQAAQPGDETGMSQLTTIHFGQCPRGTCEGQCPDAVQHGHNEVEDPDDDSAYWDEDWQGGSECASIVQS